MNDEQFNERLQDLLNRFYEGDPQADEEQFNERLQTWLNRFYEGDPQAERKQFNERLQNWLNRFYEGDPQAEDVLMRIVNELIHLPASTFLATYSRVHRFETIRDLKQDVQSRVFYAMNQVTAMTASQLRRLIRTHLSWAMKDLEKKIRRRRRIAPHQEVPDSEDNTNDHPLPPSSHSDSADGSDDEEATDPAELSRWKEGFVRLATQEDSRAPLQSDSAEEFDIAKKAVGSAKSDRQQLLEDEIDRLPPEDYALVQLIAKGYEKKEVAYEWGVDVRTVQLWWVKTAHRLIRRVRVRERQ